MKKKPFNLKNYGSIPHLLSSRLGAGDKFIEENQNSIATIDLLKKERILIVTEKYDGSNVGIAKKNGKIVPLVRKGYHAKSSARQFHRPFVDWCIYNSCFLEEILGEGERIVCELMNKTHGIMYEYTRSFPIVFIDFYNSDNTRKPFKELQKIKHFGHFVARVIWKGKAMSPENLLHMKNIGTKDMQAIGDFPEGMIYRVEDKEKVLFLAKWVRSDFVAGRFLNEEKLYNKKVIEL